MMIRPKGIPFTIFFLIVTIILSLLILFLSKSPLYALLTFLALTQAGTIFIIVNYYKREQELLADRQMLEAAWKSSNVSMIVLDSAGMMERVTPEAAATLGLDIGLEGKNINFYLQDCRFFTVEGEEVELYSLCENLLQQGRELIDIKVRMVRERFDRWLLFSVGKLLDRRGMQQGSLVVFSDITEFEQRHFEAQRHQAYLNSCIDSIPDGVVIVDNSLNISYMNRVALSWVDGEREELVGRSLEQLHDSFISSELVKLLKESGVFTNKELEYSTKTGELLYLSCSASYIEGPSVEQQGQILVIKNITPLKKSEKLLQGRLELLLPHSTDSMEIGFKDLFELDDIQALQDSFAEACSVSSIITDTKGRPVTAFSNFSRAVELKEELELNKGAGPEQKGPVVYFCRKEGVWLGGARIYVGKSHIANWLIAQGGMVDEELILRLLNKLGVELDNMNGVCENIFPRDNSFLMYCKTLHLMANKLSQLAVNNILQARAISERERVEQELKDTQSYLDNIIESMPSILISLDESNSITHWNRAASQVLKIDGEEVIGRKMSEVFQGFRRYHHIVDNIKRINKPIRFHRESFEELDGKFFDLSLYPLKSEKGGGVVIMIDDITEMERMEQQLLQAQKMETIGALAGGFAHDFNNVLMGIITTISIIKMDLQTEIDLTGLHTNMELLERSGKRAADMVKQLLSLSQKNRLNLSRIDLNESVEHVINVCRNSLDKSVTIEWSLLDEEAYLKADATQIEQVLLNLCINAAHSMTIMRKDMAERGGVLKVSVEKFYADPIFCASHSEAVEGDYYIVKVTDLGVGIEKESLDRIFEPFFTTKGKEAGTGLGLSMAYNIIRQHKGFITVYSEVEMGSTFVVYLPAAGEEEEIETKTKVDGIASGEGVVLVVDDEEIVRNLANNILKRCGYTVLTASNGKEGVELFRERAGEIKAVLLDMSMPGISGKETFKLLQEINCDVPVVMASGFGQDSRVEDVFNMGLKYFLQKPFNIFELANIVHTAIYGD